MSKIKLDGPTKSAIAAIAVVVITLVAITLVVGCANSRLRAQAPAPTTVAQPAPAVPVVKEPTTGAVVVKAAEVELPTIYKMDNSRSYVVTVPPRDDGMVAAGLAIVQLEAANGGRTRVVTPRVRTVLKDGIRYVETTELLVCFY